MSKDKLHGIVQEEYRSFPAYTFAKNGPDEAPQFRAFVSFCGLTFQSPGFCKTVRQAENAAADVALDALSAKPDDEPMQTNEPVHTNGPMQTNGPAVTVQIQSGEVHTNLQKSRNREETLQRTGNVPSTSESGTTIALLASEQKEQTIQIPHTHPQSFPSLRIRELSTSENLGIVKNKESRDNINFVSANSGNVTNIEQGHNVAAGMLGKRQRIEVLQQPEERVSTPQFLPDTQKSQLQEYAWKSGFDLPVYSCIYEGISHVAGFKATVKFNGQTYESPGLYNTVRQAEHAAAAVVLKSLSERGPTLVVPPLYKNYLQIKAQKEGRPLPVYNTTMSGQSHVPVFTCTVNFNGMTFEGKAAKSKKQAENNAAASAAISALKELGGSAVSAVQVNDDKGKAPTYDLNENRLIKAINHLKEQTTRVESNVPFNNYPKAKRVAFKRQGKKLTMEVNRFQKLIVTMRNTQLASNRVTQNIDRARVQQEGNVQNEMVDIGLGWDLPHATNPATISSCCPSDRVQPSTWPQNNSCRHGSLTRARTDHFRGRQQFRGRSRGRCGGRGGGHSSWAPTSRNEISVRVQQVENAQNGIANIGFGWNTLRIGDPLTIGWDGWGDPEDMYQPHARPHNTFHTDHSSARARASRSRSRAPSHFGGRSRWAPPPRDDKHFPMLELAISPVRDRVQEENVQNEEDIDLGWSLPDTFDPSASGLRDWKNFDDEDPPPSTSTIAPCA